MDESGAAGAGARDWASEYANHEAALIVEEDKAAVLVAWGRTLLENANAVGPGEAESLRGRAADKFAEATRADPSRAEAWFAWGTELRRLAHVLREHAGPLLQQAREKFETGLSTRASFPGAFLDLAQIIEEQSQLTIGEERERLWSEADASVQRSLDAGMDPLGAFTSWAVMLFNRARQLSGPEAESMWLSAIAKVDAAHSADAEAALPYVLFADAYDMWAETKQGVEAEALWSRSDESYRRAWELQPDDADLLYRWSGMLLRRSDHQPSARAEELRREACLVLETGLATHDSRHDLLYRLAKTLELRGDASPDAEEAETLRREAYERLVRVRDGGLLALNVHDDIAALLVKRAKSARVDDVDATWCEAFSEFERSAELFPRDPAPLRQWGVSLLDYARMCVGTDAEVALAQAAHAFERALTIEDSPATLYNCGLAMLNRAVLLPDSDAAELASLAAEKIEAGAGPTPQMTKYQLARAYALSGFGDLAKSIIRELRSSNGVPPGTSASSDAAFRHVTHKLWFRRLVDVQDYRSQPQVSWRRMSPLARVILVLFLLGLLVLPAAYDAGYAALVLEFLAAVVAVLVLAVGYHEWRSGSLRWDAMAVSWRKSWTAVAASWKQSWKARQRHKPDPAMIITTMIFLCVFFWLLYVSSPFVVPLPLPYLAVMIVLELRRKSRAAHAGRETGKRTAA